MASYLAAREAMRRFIEDGASGDDEAAIAAGYEEIKRAAGMDALYAIEAQTTERSPHTS